MNETQGQKRILVVDDEATVREFMQVILHEAGYSVELAWSGVQALERVQEVRPDLIILDVTMPGITGFEVCRRLKSDPATAVVPILIMTALEERKDRLEGVSAGATDFLNKPVDIEDLLIRVRNALKTKSFYDEVRQNYAQLKDQQGLRDHLIHFILHDIRTPLQGILAYHEFIEEKLQGTEEHEFLMLAQRNAVIIARLLEDLLSVYQMEHHQLPLHRSLSSLGDLWSEAWSTLEGLAMQRQLQVLCAWRVGDFPLYVDRDLIRRVLLNLVSNAIKYTPRQGMIELRAEFIQENEKPCLLVSIQDQGPGIPAEHHQRIFERFGVVEAAGAGARRSIGLGLTFCKLAVEAHGGRIWVESYPGSGSIFRFLLPTRG